MNVGTIIRIPDAVAARRGDRVTTQPGLPGRWSIWSKAAGSPGSHFVVPADETAREVGVKYAVVRIIEPDGETARVQLTGTEPATSMPGTRTA